MYSTKVLGNGGSGVTNHSTHKALFLQNVKAKKSFTQKPGVKK